MIRICNRRMFGFYPGLPHICEYTDIQKAPPYNSLVQSSLNDLPQTHTMQHFPYNGKLTSPLMCTSPTTRFNTINTLWQSRVEIEHYSISHFNRITAFEALKHSTSVMGGAYTRYVNSQILDMFSQHICAPTLNGGSALQCYKHSNTQWNNA